MTSPATAEVGADGATVMINSNGLPGEWHFRPDHEGHFVRVAIFELDGTWQRVAVNATLHVLIPLIEYEVIHAVDNDSATVDANVQFQDWVETAVVPFTSELVINTMVRIPEDAIGYIDGTPVNAVRVYVELTDGRISHHNLAKNSFIGSGNYDVADVLDGVYSPSIAT